MTCHHPVSIEATVRLVIGSQPGIYYAGWREQVEKFTGNSEGVRVNIFQINVPFELQLFFFFFFCIFRATPMLCGSSWARG